MSEKNAVYLGVVPNETQGGGVREKPNRRRGKNVNSRGKSKPEVESDATLKN